ncbi:hypothetical protein ACQ4PT_016584 [Festuca glaucescens]
MADLDRSPIRWQVTYHSVASRLPTFHQHGFLYLRPQALRLVLLDSEGITVDARFLLIGEKISSGTEVELPCHTVKVGTQDLPAVQAPQVPPMPSLDLRSGLSLQRKIWSLFHCSVASSSSHREFFMVASFGRSKLRLDPSSVSHMLQACLGGIAHDIHVCFLRDRSFRFSVCNRQVGFFINNLRSFKCVEFVVHFFLWGNGGPNYVREFRLWEIEEENSWQTVGRKTYLDAVRQPLTGANWTPLGRRTPQRQVPTPPPRLTFLHRLSAKETGFLESAISAGHGLEQILQAFRFGDDGSPVISFLDSLSTQQIQELRSFIASKPSMETLAWTFYAEKSAAQFSPTLAETVPPAGPDFQHISSVVTPTVTDAGAETSIQDPDLRTSVFQRLNRPKPSSEFQLLTDLFFLLRFRILAKQPPRKWANVSPGKAHLVRAVSDLDIPGLTAGISIRCHGCDKPGHIKQDCRALKETWVRKEINLSPPEGFWDRKSGS